MVEKPRNVELFIEPKPEQAQQTGLVLWRHFDEHYASRRDRNSIRAGEDTSQLKPLQFEFQQVLEWDEWGPIFTNRMKYAAKLAIPHLPELKPHTGKMAIVGAGPSAPQFLNEIKEFKKDESDNLMSVNATHAWLIDKGMPPRIHVISEHDVENVEVSLGGPPHKEVYYYLASTCHENIFRQLEGYRRVLWHPFMPLQGYQHAVARYFHGEFMVGGGYSTFFRSMTVAIVLGFRRFDLFGLDSSFEASSHMDGYQIADREPRITVWGADPTGKELKKFTTQGGLAFQASEFLEFCKFNQSALKIKVHGDGLLRYVHETRYPEQYMKGF